ncbi:MAG: hypothetical protein Q8N76_02575, partial [Candidatus Omnitrophota bacterium]|nr:hypothetical protein [Candidatus Omnitrophota bacterium]
DLFLSDSTGFNLNKGKKLDIYKDIPEEVFIDDVNELTALLVNKTNLPPGIDEFMFMRACMGLNLIGHKLRGLKARYENPSIFDAVAVHEGVGTSL